MRLLNRNVIIVIIIGMFIMIGVRFMLMSVNKMVEITVPSYGGQPDVYITKNYVERDGCVEFSDGMGVKRKVCGNYSISKW